MEWQQIGLVVSVFSPLVGVPLAVITLYLKAIRENQATTLSDLAHRIDVMETSIRDLLRATGDFDREYATKEEWVRESMLARQHLERLTEMVTRISAELETGRSVAVETGRATTAMIELVRRCTDGCGARLRDHRAALEPDPAASPQETYSSAGEAS